MASKMYVTFCLVALFIQEFLVNFVRDLDERIKLTFVNRADSLTA